MLSIYSGSCGNQTTKYYAKYKGRDADRFRLNVLKRNGECFDANLFPNGCFLRIKSWNENTSEVKALNNLYIRIFNIFICKRNIVSELF